MAKLFNDKTPVVHQGPSIRDDQMAINKRKWVLVPTLAYKILVPIDKEQRLNFFQQTILRLYLSGYKTTEYIADKLLLKEELVQYIVDELIRQGMLEKSGVVTQVGQDTLNELNAPYDLKTGYIFFDLLTRTFWDQFTLTDDLHFAMADFEKNRIRYIEMGKIDAPKRRQSLVVPPLDEQHDLPSAADAIIVINRFKRRMKSLQQGSPYIEESADSLLPRGIEKVQFLEEPIPIYLTTFIYMPSDVLNKSHWEVCHPFGKGPSAKLTDHLNQLRNTDELLRTHITDLVTETLRTSDIEREENMSKEDKQAQNYLTEVLGSKLLTFPSIVTQSIQLYKKFHQLQKLLKQENRGSNFDEIQSKFSTFFIQAAEIIEETLFIMRYFDKLKDQRRVLSYNSSLSKHPLKNGQILEDIARLLGFTDYAEEEEKVFQRLLSVSMGEVKYVEQSKNMRPLMAYHLLAARDQHNHPFHQLAKTIPTFIQYLSKLMEKRNEFAHTTEVTYFIETTDQVFFFTLKILSLLLGLPFQVGAIQKEVDFNQDELIIDKKERLLCEQLVDLHLSSTIRTKPTLFKALTDLHYYRKTRNHHFALKAVSVLEEVFNLMLEEISLQGIEKLIKPDGRQTLYTIKPMLNSYGFVVDIGQLPESFTHANLQNLRFDKKKLKNSVLSRKVYAFLAAICVQKDERWSQLANVSPDFIPLIAEISDKRKHGHVNLEDDVMQEMEEQLFDFIKTIEPFFESQRSSVYGGK